MLGHGLELLSVFGDRFEINQLLFADDIALVADSEDNNNNNNCSTYFFLFKK